MVTPAAAGRAALRGLRALAADLTDPAAPPWPPGRARWVMSRLVATVAVTFGVVTVGVAADAGAGTGTAVALGAVQAVPLLVALVRPVAGAWLSLLAGMVVSEAVRAGGPGLVWSGPSLLTHLGVLALAALAVRPRILAELWLLTLLAGTVLVQRMPGLNASEDLAAMTSLSAVVLLAAGAVHGRREARRRLAEQERISDAERARRTLLEERARIARELHDVVAHHLSVIAIQAEAAPYRAPDAPEALTGSFATIRANAVEGLGELRRVLGLLRDDHDPEDGPQPTLDRLADLVANGRDAGLAVTASVGGDRCPPGSSCRPTGSCRRRSATPCATRRVPRSPSRSPTGPPSWSCAW